MNKLDLLQLARKNLWRRKIRTFLTTLGVLIGTTSIVVMLSLGIGLNDMQRKNMESWGSLTMIRVQQGMIFDQEGNPLKEGKQLNDEAVEELKTIEGVIAVSPVYDYGGDARWGRKRGGLSLVGLDPKTMSQLEFTPEYGRLLQEGDRNVMVVGREVINNFRDESFIRQMRRGMPIREMEQQDPMQLLNQHIAMTFYGGSSESRKVFNFNVVGILEGERKEHSYQAYVPIDDIKRIRKMMSSGGSGRERVMVREMSAKGMMAVPSTRRGTPQQNQDDYSYILVRTADVDQSSMISQKLKDMGYNTWSMADQLEGIEKTSRTIQAILGGIGGITLLVAALGITNTMIMSIYERTKEIGIMKVIGASFVDIHTMFLTEAGMIGFIGGIFGLGFSYLISYIINYLSQDFMNRGMPPGTEAASISLIPVWLALFALAFSILIGVVAGLYPAYRAVQLSPISAIRNE